MPIFAQFIVQFRGKVRGKSARMGHSQSRLPASGAAGHDEFAHRQLADALANPFFAEALFDVLPDVVFFVKDASGRYLVVNQTLARRCGFRHKSEMLGHSPLEVFPPELGASYAAQDQQVIESGQAIHNQLELHLSAHQTSIWCMTHKIPLLDREGSVIGLSGISRDLRTPDRDHPVYQRIAEVVLYIQKNYAEPLKLESLAHMARLSVSQLERHMQHIFDLTPKQLIIKTRLEAATRLLKEEGCTISEIAHACGYADHSAFSRQFKATIGLSPTEYRKLNFEQAFATC